MLSFEHLKYLDTHITFLRSKIRDPHPLFLVGGCVRDPLLGLDKNPNDIDFTMAGDPKTLDTLIDKKGMSYFMTEKFGTITLIPHGNQLVKSKVSKVESLKYELTPLRTEDKYDDFRHPGEIQRSNNILLDSQRRDFTINCMYYTHTPYTMDYASLLQTNNIHTYSDDEFFLKQLDEQGYVFLQDFALLIIQDHQHITQLFQNGMIQSHHLATLLKSATTFTAQKHGAIKLQRGKLLRILIDPHQGIHDSMARKLKAVGEPDKRFTEDALRIVRAIRFVNVINERLKDAKHKKSKNQLAKDGIKTSPVLLFDFDKATWNSLKKNHALVQNVAKERIKEEIMKAFTVGNPFGFVSLLDEAQLLKHLFPALYATKNIEQPIRYHPFDIYVHTLLCLFELQKINKDPLVRLAMLYHDVGKVNQFGAYAEGLSKEEIREILAGPLNHRRSSPEYAKKDFKDLGFSSKEIADICRYIAHHHTPEEMIFAKAENREKKIRTFLSEAGYIRALHVLDITMADRLGQYNPLQNSNDLTDVEDIQKILKKLHKKEGQFTMKQLVVDGEDIMTTFGLSAGPLIGKLLRKVFERVLVDTSRNTKKQILGFLKIQIKHLTK